MPKPRAFHWRDGWYFSRTESGDVMIEPGTDHEVIVPAAEWASIVASVTPKGDTAETYGDAVRLHDGHGDRNPN